MGDRATLHVIHQGSIDGDHVSSTVSLILDGDARLVVDPGMVADRGLIVEGLARHGVEPERVTHVLLTHHHPDHTLNAALFPMARIHDYWAIYQGDVWTDRAAEGFALSPSIRLIETPGHTPQDITTIVLTGEGTVACTHLWWSAQGPAEDPLALDPSALHRNRARVLQVATLIVPGHGAPFKPLAETPR